MIVYRHSLSHHHMGITRKSTISLIQNERYLDNDHRLAAAKWAV